MPKILCQPTSQIFQIGFAGTTISCGFGNIRWHNSQNYVTFAHSPSITVMVNRLSRLSGHFLSPAQEIFQKFSSVSSTSPLFGSLLTIPFIYDMILSLMAVMKPQALCKMPREEPTRWKGSAPLHRAYHFWAAGGKSSAGCARYCVNEWQLLL